MPLEPEYRTAEAYSKRNWLWLWPALFFGGGLIGFIIGKIG